MPRNHNAGPSTLRNRNRVTNKTRLKVITESIDADPIILDEDEEKIRVVSTAGVDAEDANEHHLQAVLSAAATRHQSNARATRGASGKEQAASVAYIPTPDSTGVVDNYEELYPVGRWKDTATYLKFSDTVEESISFALANGFIYYMDDRDKEWLDKNNEEARGEGTSAQGAVSGTSTRSGRSSKAKGKDPDVTHPVAMSEDEFELVMAIFEKVTHEKTEFLHHGLEQGTPFPPFSDYQDTFATELLPSMFALFSVPSWIPPPPQLQRLARTIYPYWRERRLERSGHPIIPSVNLDETDAKNESYICFRRREIKAVRKTRAQQATYSDKMMRLQSELAVSLELAKGVSQRETLKRDAARQSHAVWEKRFVLADFKRKFPSLSGKEDEELFHDKERVPKKPKTEATSRLPLKLRPRDNGELGSPITHAEPLIRPKERQAQIQNQIEEEMAKRKEKDHHWEDVIDNSYQPYPTPYASKLFKVIAATRRSSSSSSSTEDDSEQYVRPHRAGRLRYGRGGRLHLDRRIIMPRIMSMNDFLPEDDLPDVEAQDRARRLAERWRYDDDDSFVVGSDGSEEKDRVLLDDYQPRYLAHHMTLLSEQDHLTLATDASITTTSSDGRQQTHVPFRLGAQSSYRRDMSVVPRQGTASITSGQALSLMPAGSPSMPMSPSTPVSVATQLKKMPPPSIPHMRISSNMRPPGLPTVPAIHPNGQTSLGSPQITPPINVVQANGVHEIAGHTEDGGEQNANFPALASPNGRSQTPSDQSQSLNASVTPSTSPVRPKAQIQQPISMPTMPNGYHIPSVNSFSTPMPTNQYMHPAVRHNPLTVQQMQSLKAYAALNSTPDASMQGHNANLQLRTPASYMGHNASYVQQMSAQRQMQYLPQQQQRPPSVGTTETVGIDGLSTPALSPPLPGVPVRTPSANGMRNALSRGVAVPNMTQAMGQAQGRASPANIARFAGPMSPSPHLLNASLSAAQPHSSPTRSPQPPLATPSPSLQARHAVGSSGAGY